MICVHWQDFYKVTNTGEMMGNTTPICDSKAYILRLMSDSYWFFCLLREITQNKSVEIAEMTQRLLHILAMMLQLWKKLSIVDTCVHFLWKRSSTFSRFWKGSWNQKILRTLSLWRYCCQSEFCTPELCLSSQVGSLAPLHLEQAAVGDDCLLCSANRLLPALLPQSSPNMLRYAWTL